MPRNPLLTAAKKLMEPDEFKEFSKLVKNVNTRLTNLEKLSKIPEFRNVKQYAYRVAQSDIHALGGEAKRFTDIPVKNKTDIERVQRALNVFTESKTSTKGGILSVYEKRARSINKTLGLTGEDRLTWDELINVFDYMKDQKTAMQFDSTIIMKAFTATKNMNKSKSKKAISAGLKTVKRIADDEVEQVLIEEVLKDIPKALLL